MSRVSFAWRIWTACCASMLAKIRPAQSSSCLKIMQQPTAFLSVPYPPSLANPAARSRFVGSLDASSPSKDRSTFWRSREDCWRPDVRDVEKISWGLPAKKKRTGSRGVPHRLNEDERRAFDQARRQGFLQVTGSSWRSQRRDAPLLNSYRSLMDARSRPMIVLHKMSPQSEVHTGDRLVVDLSPLRLPTEFKEVVEEELKKRVFEEFAVEGSYLIVEEDDALTQVSSVASDDDEGWGTRPIYQLPPYSFSWNVDRQKGKGIGKFLAILFDNAEAKAKASSKPRGVKPGKSRRHGGYGIG